MKVYILTVVIFITAKLVFMLVNYEGHAFAIGDVCDVVLHGLSLDLSTSLYILILPFLITMVSLWWNDRRLQAFLRIYYAVIATMLMLTFVADTSLRLHRLADPWFLRSLPSLQSHSLLGEEPQPA